MHNLYSSIQGCSWCSCPDVCCQLWCWRFLQDKAEEPVLPWGRRTQQDTVFHLLYLIPSCNRTLPSSPLKRKKKKKKMKGKTPCAGWRVWKEVHREILMILLYTATLWPNNLPAFEPRWQNVPGGHRDPVLLSVGFGTEAPVTQRKPAAQNPEGPVKPSEAQNRPAGHARHSPANAQWQLGPHCLVTFWLSRFVC